MSAAQHKWDRRERAGRFYWGSGGRRREREGSATRHATQRQGQLLYCGGRVRAAACGLRAGGQRETQIGGGEVSWFAFGFSLARAFNFRGFPRKDTRAAAGEQCCLFSLCSLVNCDGWTLPPRWDACRRASFPWCQNQISTNAAAYSP